MHHNDIHDWIAVWISHCRFFVWLSMSSLCINTNRFPAPRYHDTSRRQILRHYIRGRFFNNLASVTELRSSCVALIDLKIVRQILRRVLRNDLDLFTQTRTCLLSCLYKKAKVLVTCMQHSSNTCPLVTHTNYQVHLYIFSFVFFFLIFC